MAAGDGCLEPQTLSETAWPVFAKDHGMSDAEIKSASSSLADLEGRFNVLNVPGPGGAKTNFRPRMTTSQGHFRILAALKNQWLLARGHVNTATGFADIWLIDSVSERTITRVCRWSVPSLYYHDAAQPIHGKAQYLISMTSDMCRFKCYVSPPGDKAIIVGPSKNLNIPSVKVLQLTVDRSDTLESWEQENFWPSNIDFDKSGERIACVACYKQTKFIPVHDVSGFVTTFESHTQRPLATNKEIKVSSASLHFNSAGNRLVGLRLTQRLPEALVFDSVHLNLIYRLELVLSEYAFHMVPLVDTKDIFVLGMLLYRKDTREKLILCYSLPKLEPTSLKQICIEKVSLLDPGRVIDFLPKSITNDIIARKVR